VKRAVLVVAMMALTTPARAQHTAGPDSATAAVYQQVLKALRDTVSTVAARSNEFRRDLRTVGAGTVVARAEALARACTATRGALVAARPGIAGWPLADRGGPQRDSLLVAMRRLTERIDAECLRGLSLTGPGERADSLRAWGPYRTSNLNQAMTAYHSAAASLARRLGVNLSGR
jgi:hypothetical protein